MACLLIEALESRCLLSAATEVSLASALNRNGIVADHSKFSATGGFDGLGDALSRSLTGTSKTWNGNPYAISSPTGNNVVSTAGQTITLPAGNDSSLTLLAAGVSGSQASQKFIVTYTDKTTQTFTQSISDWTKPSHFAGESTVLSMTYRDRHDGVEVAGAFYIYGYLFALNPAKTVKSILLPKNSHLEILAMDVTKFVDTLPPTMPTNLAATTVTAGSVTLTWTASTDNIGVSTYSIYRNGVFAGSVSGTTKTFIDSGLDPNAAYTYYVVAADAAGNKSAASLTLPVTTLSTDVSEAPGIAGTWNLSFGDNFNTLNSWTWAPAYWWGGNDGTQATFDPKAVTVSNGTLSLTATKQSETANDGVTNPYTSGLISTGGIDSVQPAGFTFTYGYIECRTKMAPGYGMWNALWMLPVSHQDDYEMDVFENLGRLPTTFQGFDHAWPTFGYAASASLGFDMTKAYHTYGLDWEPDHVSWYVDGKVVATYANTKVIPQQAMYLMMNLDVGGSWAGIPNGGTPLSSSWDVDYLRVWQHPGDTYTLLPPPAMAPVNDNLANSTVISGTSISLQATNVGATKETGEPDHAGNSGGASVWWTWTAPADGTVSINTQGSSIDTLLAVYTGDAIATLMPVPGGSSIGDPTGATAAASNVSFAVTSGTTYRIAVDGFNGASGSISLNVALN